MSAERKNKEKFKSTVKGQINRLVIILVIVSLLLVGGVSCWLNYSSIISNAEIALEKTARVAADEIQYRLGSMMNIVEVLGTIEVLGDEQISLDVKRSILDEHMEKYSFRSSRIMDTQGISIFDPEKDLSARDYFKTAMTGKVAISDPIFSSTNGELIITIAAPVWAGGLRNSEIAGVVMITLDAKGLSGIAADINVSENGAAFLLNSEGTAIAHPEYSYVEEARNTIQLAKSDKSLTDAAAIETKMINRESGIGYQTYQGERTIVAYAPVEGLNNWSLGIYAPVSDFTHGTKLSIIIIFVLLMVTLLIAVMIVQRLARGIGEPVHKCAERIALLVEGDLHSSMPAIHTENETGILVRATQEHVGSLNSILQDLDYCLDEIAKGNFAVSGNPAVNYCGDFKRISISVESICNRLNNTLSQIDQVAEQVSCSSEQVSKDAQVLSQGAIEQANSVADLFETINATAVKIKQNSQDAVAAKKQSDASGRNVEESNFQMQELVGAMEKINEKSNEIGKIIKTIDDIAFQTNTLALNASIEASRAGEAGKGFAVVADEVRRLAGKSAEAAKNTSDLVEESVDAVENGTKIANAAAKSMLTAVEGVRSASHLIDGISVSSNEQAGSISQIIGGVQEISTVVQANSVTAGKSAEASEELSGQAQMLKSLVDKFQLN